MPLTTGTYKEARWLRRILLYPAVQSKTACPAMYFPKGHADATPRFSDALRFGLALAATGPAGTLVPAHCPGRAWRAMTAKCFTFVCGKCRKKTEFLTVQYVIAATGASRSSLYRWMDRRLVHYRVLPTGHRLICKESLGKLQPIEQG